jgi:hypothetical protein
MTRHPQPDPSPPHGTRPPEYVIELWVSPQLTERTRPAARKGHRQPGPQSQARQHQPEGEPIPGPLDRSAQPRARRPAEPELEAG